MVVGDGRSIPIMHSGIAFLSTGNSKLFFKDLLHVPQIHKNLGLF